MSRKIAGIPKFFYETFQYSFVMAFSNFCTIVFLSFNSEFPFIKYIILIQTCQVKKYKKTRLFQNGQQLIINETLSIFKKKNIGY